MKKFVLVGLPVTAIILELLPNGAVLNFANPEGTPIQNTYSYFSLTPFGYANFGPFLTAVLTCVLLLLAVIYAINNSRGVYSCIKIFSVVAVLTSLMPLLYGFDYFSVVGVLISVILFAETIMSNIKQKDNN